MTQSLSDPLLRDLRDRLVLSQREYRKDSELCTRCGVTHAPTIVLLDPSRDKSEEHPIGRIAGSRSARELRRDFDDLLGSAPAAAGSSGATTTPAAPAPRPEELSDDEVDRRFIQARMSLAIDLNKKGKTPKAVEILEDLLQSYPKHVLTATVRDLLEQMKK